MKRFLSLFVVALYAILPVIAEIRYGGGSQWNSGISIWMYRQSKDDIEPENPGYGERMPSRRIPAIITECSVAINGVEEDEIESYEIYTADGLPVEASGSVCDFTSTLFLLKGEYKICFLTSGTMYIGYVMME